MYDPQVGQFLSEDPIGFDANDPNLKRMVGNNTPNLTDPFGLEAIPQGVPGIFGAPGASIQHQGEQTQLDERRLREMLETLALDEVTPAGALARLVLDPDAPQVLIVVWNNDDEPMGDLSRSRMQIQLAPTGTFLPPTTNLGPLGFVTNTNPPQPASPDDVALVVLAHELGHAVARLTDPDRTRNNPDGSNVTLVENPLRTALGLAPRPGYPNATGTPIPTTVDPDEAARLALIVNQYPPLAPTIGIINNVFPPSLGMAGDEEYFVDIPDVPIPVNVPNAFPNGTLPQIAPPPPVMGGISAQMQELLRQQHVPKPITPHGHMSRGDLR